MAIVPVFLILSVVVFALMRWVLGDPALLMLGQEVDWDLAQRIREELGFNRPLVLQYLDWLWHIVRGDLGRSFRMPFSVSELVLARIPVTLVLSALAILVAVAGGIAMGMLSAVRENSRLDTAISMGAVVGLSMPNFWLGILFIYLFALRLGWLPSSGYVSPLSDPVAFVRSMVLPVATLSVSYMAVITRYVRATMLDVLHEQYILVARSKGLSDRVVMTRHAFSNVLIPVITLVGVNLASLFSGAVVTETIFGLPGVGTLMLNAILGRDIPVVQGTLLFVSVAVLLTSIAVDVLYCLVDPRVRYD